MNSLILFLILFDLRQGKNNPVGIRHPQNIISVALVQKNGFGIFWVKQTDFQSTVPGISFTFFCQSLYCPGFINGK